MAKTRTSKILPTSEQIIKLLKKGKSIGEIVKLGYSESTIKYYRRKLFHKRSYNRFVKKVAGYNKNRNERLEAERAKRREYARLYRLKKKAEAVQ